MSDASLTSRFRTEVLPLGQRLFRIALSVTLNAQDAEDVVQDVMLRLWERRDEWKTIGSLEAWCVTSVRHAAIDCMRRSGEKSLMPQDDTRQESFTPHDELVAVEGRDILHRLMDGLPEVQRTIFILREAEGHTYAEIGEMLRLSDSQVKTYLLRARRKVRELFTHFTGA